MRKNRLVVFGLISGPVLAATMAHAEPSTADKERAKQLYQQAAADMLQEAYERACPQFAAALQLDPHHIRTAISLGTCEERWGKFQSALRRFEYARSLAVTQSAAEKIVEIDGLSVDLKHRLPHLRIVVPERIASLEGLTVVRNGTIVPVSEFGKTITLDPGTVDVMASSPVSGVWKAQVKLEPGKTAEITVGGTSAPTYTKNQDTSGFDTMPKSPKSPESPESPVEAQPGGIRRKLGFAGIGIGLAGVVAGSVAGGLAISKNSASDDGHCDVNNYCDAVGTDLRYGAQKYASVSTGLFIAGGVLLTTGIVLVATAPSEKAKMSLWIGPTSVGLRGQW